MRIKGNRVNFLCKLVSFYYQLLLSLSSNLYNKSTPLHCTRKQGSLLCLSLKQVFFYPRALLIHTLCIFEEEGEEEKDVLTFPRKYSVFQKTFEKLHSSITRITLFFLPVQSFHFDENRRKKKKKKSESRKVRFRRMYKRIYKRRSIEIQG